MKFEVSKTFKILIGSFLFTWLAIDFDNKEYVSSENLFFLLPRGFFPVVIGFIRRVPVLGSLLNLPGIRSVSNHVLEIKFLNLQNKYCDVLYF